MDLIESLKNEYGMEPKQIKRKAKPVQRQASTGTRVIYVPVPMQYTKKTRANPKPISYWTQLREEKGKKALRQFHQAERREQIQKVSSGVHAVGSGVYGGAKTVGSFAKKRAGAIKRVGWKGVFKSSIY